MPGKIETRVGMFVLLALCVFAYMGFRIGAFRFDRSSYNKYIVYFKDISGLSRKGDVKIAGVKVGWVEEIALVPDDHTTTIARATVMIKKEYALYQNATGLVRQDGMLGPKFIELLPGNPMYEKMSSNSVLTAPTIEQASIDEIMRQFKHIATNIEEVTDSFKNALGGAQGEESVRQFVYNAGQTAKQLSVVAETVANAFARNESQLDHLLTIGTNFRQITDVLQQEIFPSFQQSIEKISQVFDRDFDRIASHLSSTATSLEGTAEQAKDGISKISSVVQKIDEGKGLLGKLVNEDELYGDLKTAVDGFKSYMSRIERLEIIFDSHFESMHRSAENYQFEDSKGYVDVRIHPNEDYFYLIQFASSQKGFIDRQERLKRYIDDNLQTIYPDTLNLTDNNKVENIFRKEKTYINRNSLKLGIQFGKIFGDVAIRCGLFEGTAGVGVDVDIPFGTENFRWVTTLELFDMSGWNRIEDRRPHFKWLNRMYFMRNLYITFGADDFVSRHNASGFVGAGLRFADDDIKYFLSSISGLGSVS
ncbi:MAG TPA: MlaD family protein [Patescibacteria group bacterium]|nr:MlaD family protein [Patescibacteria group bacterium]